MSKWAEPEVIETIEKIGDLEYKIDQIVISNGKYYKKNKTVKYYRLTK